MAAEIQLGWNNSKLESGAKGAASIVDRASKDMQSALGKIGSIPTPAWIAGGLAGAAAAVTVGAIKNLADEYDNLYDRAQQLNESPESLQRIGLQAKLTGSDLETVFKALQKMNLEIRKGADSDGNQALKALGIDAAAFVRLSPERQLAELAEGFQNAQKNGQGFTEVFDLMGKKFGDLLPLLRTSKETLQEIAEAPVISEEQLISIAEANDVIDIATKALKNFGAATISGTIRDVKSLIGAFTYGPEYGTYTERVAKLQAAIAGAAKEQADANEVSREAQREADALNAEYEQLAAECEAYEEAQADANKEIKKGGEEATKANEALTKLQATLKGEQTRTLDLQLIDLEKLELAKADLADIERQLAAVKGQKGGESLTAQLGIEREKKKQSILTLEERIRDAEAQTAEQSQKLTSEKTKQESQQIRNLALFDLELDILEAQARGQDRKAEKLQREADIIETTARLVDDLGLSYEEANRKAEQLVNAKAKTEKQRGGKDDNNRSTIQGYSQDQGGMNEARDRAQKRTNTSRQMYDESINKHFGNFSLMDSKIRSSLDENFGGRNMPDPSTTRGLPAGGRTPAAETAKDGGMTELTTAFDAFATKTTEIFERALN
jgi:hypothetical protein